MIDLHSHILPELDDGAQRFRDSLEMAQLAVKSGVTAMVATPHCMQGGAREVTLTAKLLQEALQEDGIRLRLYVGMEIFGTMDTLRLLKEGQLLTINNSRYPLVEFAFHSDGEMETRILHQLVEAGYQPLVAHPERYYYIQEEPTILNRWKKMGCLFQINKGSLTGRFGRTPQHLAMALVDRGFATVVASDAHSPIVRTPWMQDVQELLTEEFSPVAAEYLLHRNPLSIIRNEQLLSAEPAWFE